MRRPSPDLFASTNKKLMNCRLLTILLLSVSIQSFGQKYQDFTITPTSARVIKTDTIVAQAKAVATTPALPLPMLVNNGKKPVPLAGQSAYFGSMNDFVMDFTRRYMEQHDKTLEVVKKRGEDHFSLIDNVLEQNNVPKELKYLAVIESALNHNAISRVGAVGPWQFMASTARLMGLTVSKKRDERKDVYKSTYAAAKYLNYLYDQLNDWLLVVAAYNSGPTPVQKAIQKTGSSNFWDIKPYLPKETQGHVMAFIATASIFENMSKFIGLGGIPEGESFTDPSATPEPSVEEVKPAVVVKKSLFSDEDLKNMAIVRITTPLHLDVVALDLGIDRKLLDKWNPDYSQFETKKLAVEYYSLRIPKDKLDSFIEKKEALNRRSKQMYAQMGN
jgi:membrane-bound lytic murein transglycosylase D